MPSWTDRSHADITAPTIPPSRFLPGRRPRLIAHRGLALDGAENTLRAFRSALDAGATMLETDTRATADGTALAFHDATLRRVAGDERRIDTLRDSDLPHVQIAAGEPVARLTEVLDTFRDVPINIDVKDAHAISPAVEAIALTNAADRICLTSFDGRVAQQAVKAVARRTGIRPVRSPSRGAMAALVATSVLGLPRALSTRVLQPYGALQVPVRYQGVPVVTPDIIARAHSAGCEVHVWTIDDPQQMRVLLATGVDGIITNRVDLLHEVLHTAD